MPLSSIVASGRWAKKPLVHFERIACSNTVVKSWLHRDRIVAQDDVIGFEMESAGTWDYLPTIMVKSVCDYADSHKDKRCLRYAAATAAACTKAVLEEWIGINGKMIKLANLDIRHISAKAPFTIPFRRVEDFVECEALCDQISERCSAPGSRTALVGLGGVG
jgi:hypothetical protein